MTPSPSMHDIDKNLVNKRSSVKVTSLSKRKSRSLKDVRSGPYGGDALHAGSEDEGGFVGHVSRLSTPSACSEGVVGATRPDRIDTAMHGGCDKHGAAGMSSVAVLHNSECDSCACFFKGNHYGTPLPSERNVSNANSQTPKEPFADPTSGKTPSSEGKRRRNRSNVEALAAAPPAGGLVNTVGTMEQNRSSVDSDGFGALPTNWEKSRTDTGEIYFIDHNTGTTHWLDPRMALTGKRPEECDEGELPYGWERVIDPQYGEYFIDHINRRTQYEHPIELMKRGGQAAPYSSTLPRPKKSEMGEPGVNLPRRALSAGAVNAPRPFFTRNPDELKGEAIKCTLVKSPRGFGFTIVGGDDTRDEFLQIKNVVPNGPAHADGKLKQGDVLVYVNKSCVLGCTHQDVVQIFQSTSVGQPVELTLCRGYPLPFDPNDPNTEIITTMAVDAANDGQASQPPEVDVLVMKIVKGSMGFGFTITDFPFGQAPYGQKVKKVFDRARCPELYEGDVLLAVNGESIRDCSHQDVVKLLNNCPRNQPTEFVVQRGLSLSSSQQQDNTSDGQDQEVSSGLGGSLFSSTPKESGGAADHSEQHNYSPSRVENLTREMKQVAVRSDDEEQGYLSSGRHPQDNGGEHQGHAGPPNNYFSRSFSADSYESKAPVVMSYPPISEHGPYDAQDSSAASPNVHGSPIRGQHQSFDERNSSLNASRISNDFNTRNFIPASLYAPLPAGDRGPVSQPGLSPNTVSVGQASTAPSYYQPPLQQTQEGEEEEEEIEMTVFLLRDPDGFGFRIVGGTEDGSQVSIGQIVPGGAADRDGRLREGDEIVMVDGHPVVNVSHMDVVKLMENAAVANRVTLGVRRRLRRPASDLSYPYDVTITRQEHEGFGFVILSTRNKAGSTIGNIKEGTPAHKCGYLRNGDRILVVNGIDITHMSHSDIVKLIKMSGLTVTVTVGGRESDAGSVAGSQRSLQLSTTSNASLRDVPNIQLSPSRRQQGMMGREPGGMTGRDEHNPSPSSGFGSHPPYAQQNQLQKGAENLALSPGRGLRVDPFKALYSQTTQLKDGLVEVTLSKGPRGFGFSIRGGAEFQNMPLYVLKIAEGGPAHQHGGIKVGDEIHEINGHNTKGMSHAEAIELIKDGGPMVQLILKHSDKPVPGMQSSIPKSASNGPLSHSSPSTQQGELLSDWAARGYRYSPQGDPFHTVAPPGDQMYNQSYEPGQQQMAPMGRHDGYRKLSPLTGYGPSPGGTPDNSRETGVRDTYTGYDQLPSAGSSGRWMATEHGQSYNLSEIRGGNFTHTDRGRYYPSPSQGYTAEQPHQMQYVTSGYGQP